MDLLLILEEDSGLEVGEKGRVEGIMFLILGVLSQINDGPLVSYHVGQNNDGLEAGQPGGIGSVVSPTAPARRGRDDPVD